ncbi:MAG: transcription/translation regulatory transformer protein RfaH, partial [Betaproteobacteria bacterium]
PLNWYLVHSKPRQEKVALENLHRQDFVCYLPLLRIEKIRRGVITVVDEPLFTRYLFVQLDTDSKARSWAPIHSTRGVARLVRFGTEPARVDDALIDSLRQQEAQVGLAQRLFEPGQKVLITEGAFAGVEGIFELSDGQARAMVLIELISRPVSLPVHPAALQAVP